MPHPGPPGAPPPGSPSPHSRRAGFDVWIVSASPQPVVDVWARGVDVAPGNVIGIRSTTERGRYTSHLSGCGTERPGDDSQITYIVGKRCWINKEIFGLRGAAASRVQAPAKRPVFAAGDSDTDVSMLRDATGPRLALNRNKAEPMCRSYDDADGKWLVNPMFIGPKGRVDGTYPYATTGYTRSDGTSRPVRRGDGSVIPDQNDAVFARLPYQPLTLAAPVSMCPLYLRDQEASPPAFTVKSYQPSASATALK